MYTVNEIQVFPVAREKCGMKKRNVLVGRLNSRCSYSSAAAVVGPGLNNFDHVMTLHVLRVHTCFRNYFSIGMVSRAQKLNAIVNELAQFVGFKCHDQEQ